MAASLAKLDTATRVAVFFIDSEEDLITLPTLTGAGTGSLSTVNGIAQGSKAILTNSDSVYYRIRGDSSWVKITSSGGGGISGTVDWNTQVTNKPTINGKPLEGNVTSDDIDVASEAQVTGENLVFG